jgi:hypothetical protein
LSKVLLKFLACLPKHLHGRVQVHLGVGDVGMPEIRGQDGEEYIRVFVPCTHFCEPTSSEAVAEIMKPREPSL